MARKKKTEAEQVEMRSWKCVRIGTYLRKHFLSRTLHSHNWYNRSLLFRYLKCLHLTQLAFESKGLYISFMSFSLSGTPYWYENTYWHLLMSIWRQLRMNSLKGTSTSNITWQCFATRNRIAILPEHQNAKYPDFEEVGKIILKSCFSLANKYINLPVGEIENLMKQCMPDVMLKLCYSIIDANSF